MIIGEGFSTDSGGLVCEPTREDLIPVGQGHGVDGTASRIRFVIKVTDSVADGNDGHRHDQESGCVNVDEAVVLRGVELAVEGIDVEVEGLVGLVEVVEVVDVDVLVVEVEVEIDTASFGLIGICTNRALSEAMRLGSSQPLTGTQDW
jgi:hypothetical protein